MPNSKTTQYVWKKIPVNLKRRAMAKAKGHQRSLQSILLELVSSWLDGPRLENGHAGACQPPDQWPKTLAEPLGPATPDQPWHHSKQPRSIGTVKPKSDLDF
jgi:hypothetical protein